MSAPEGVLLELVQQDFSIVGDFGDEFVDEGMSSCLLIRTATKGSTRMKIWSRMNSFASDYVALEIGRTAGLSVRPRPAAEPSGLWLRRGRVNGRSF